MAVFVEVRSQSPDSRRAGKACVEREIFRLVRADGWCGVDQSSRDMSDWDPLCQALFPASLFFATRLPPTNKTNKPSFE